jgi:antirestriction protein
MSTQTNTEPSIYIGTFAKYNSGSIKGAWISLEGHDAETFTEACKALHSDEADPEFMFQDFEGFPKSFYSECSLPAALWDWLECSESEREIWENYAEAVGYSIHETTLDEAQDAYCGEFDSVEDFAEQTCEECKQLSDIPDFLRACIDWEAVWNSALRFDYCEHNGHFFRSN